MSDRLCDERRGWSQTGLISRIQPRPAALVCILLATSHMELEHIVHRVREEFREMPGLRLTPAQAKRLWGLEHEMCREVIDRLVSAAFLRWTPGGAVTKAEG